MTWGLAALSWLVAQIRVSEVSAPLGDEWRGGYASGIGVLFDAVGNGDVIGVFQPVGNLASL